MVHEGLYPTCSRSGRESSRKTHAADKGREIGSATTFGRSTMTRWGGRCERWIWLNRMESMVREHMANMVDGEAMVIRMERMGMLEMEDEVDKGQ